LKIVITEYCITNPS